MDEKESSWMHAITLEGIASSLHELRRQKEAGMDTILVTFPGFGQGTLAIDEMIGMYERILAEHDAGDPID